MKTNSTFNRVDYTLLTQLYQILSPSGQEDKMIDFLCNEIEKIGAHIETDAMGNLYITKGKAETYPCIVAHTDQVQSHYADDYQVHIDEDKDKIYACAESTGKEQGLGADDKNGIYIALEMLKKYEQVKVAFFTQEEKGCKGSENAKLAFFEDVRFILQCDRRYGNDLITSIDDITLASDAFLRDLNYETFDYMPNEGGHTDVYQLATRGVGVSVVNISCGYYKPHTPKEFTVISELLNCLRFVDHIFANLTKTYPHRAV